jgi:hypothetical protein
MGHSDAVDEWEVRTRRGAACALHQLELPPVPAPSVWVQQVTGPALVLGSAQPDDLVDRTRAAAEGVEVCRRRTGGGLVGLATGDCWIDVLLPAGSRLWHPDVGRAFHWLGEVWAETLRDLLPPAEGSPVVVHRGPLGGGEAARLLCFAGLGPGEVTVGGRKVVGLSQRRWRTGVKFQCLVLPRWLPESIGRYVAPGRLRHAGIVLEALPIGLADPRLLPGQAAIAERFVRHLPSPGHEMSAGRRRADLGVNPAVTAAKEPPPSSDQGLCCRP